MNFREHLIKALIEYKYYKRHGEMLEDQGGHLTHEDNIPMAQLQADLFSLDEADQRVILDAFKKHQD